MISHGKNVKVFCANANRPFAEGVCRKLWLPLGDCTVTTFADGEVSLTINEVEDTPAGTRIEVVAHGKPRIGTIDGTGQVIAFRTYSLRNRLRARTCRRQEDGVSIGTG